MAEIKDIVEFEIGSALYGMDISLVREIVEMLPITRLPGSQKCIVGVINLRGEVTMIVSISELLSIRGQSDKQNEKIIVLVPDLTGGSNIGIIVTEVHSVLSVPVEDIEPFSGILATDSGGFVKGIIKTSSGDKERLEVAGKNSRLMLYLDMEQILTALHLPCKIH
ncbi:MAG: chemotaxis protein CheW [Methanomicrobiales archaeon]